MVSLNVFTQDAFSTLQLTEAIEKVPYQPTGLGELDLFEDDPIRTTACAIEQRQGKLVLIPFSDRGEEGVQRTTELRQARYFNVPRIMTSDTITAQEIQGIREFGQESELIQVEREVARRLAGPTGLLRNIEYTWEFHRLAAIQGLLLDADGKTIVYNWYTEFAKTPPAEIGFNLAAATPNTLRPICNGIVRDMARASQGAFTPQTEVWALCGDLFYDQFVNHPDVIRTFLNWEAARDIRDGDAGAAFSSFRFSGITWYNYRGSDDTTTIAVPPDKVKFFPRKAPGIFRRALAPGETFEWVNTLGKPVYVIPIYDLQRKAWWKMEAYSYPLHICTRPEVLFSGRAEA
jgi:hypothetical protein